MGFETRSRAYESLPAHTRKKAHECTMSALSHSSMHTDDDAPSKGHGECCATKLGKRGPSKNQEEFIGRI